MISEGSMSTENKCPVCGKGKSTSSVSACDCDACGFPDAYVRYFASRTAYDRWVRAAEAFRQQLEAKEKQQHMASLRFWLGNNMAAFADLSAQRVTIILSSGKVQTEENATAFTANERNYAVLYNTGNVRVFGEDNSFGQKNTEEWGNIASIEAAPNCIFGVTKSGKVVCAGAVGDSDVTGWSGMKLLRSGIGFIAGLSTDGRVKISRNGAALEGYHTADGWRDIQDLAVSRDCIVGLQSSGTLVFAGRPNDARRKATEWKDLIAVAADDCYVYGLTKDGMMHAAGTCKPIFDKGRSKVGAWSGIIALSSCASGVGAVDEEGNLQFAGFFTGDITRIRKAWNSVTRSGNHAET